MTSLNGSPATLSNQQIAVLLCGLSYNDPQTNIGTYLPGWSIVWNGQVTTDGNYAFIAANEDASIHAVAIRGSLPPFDVSWDSFANWVLEDLDVITTVDWSYVSPTTTGAKITAGANRAFTQVNEMQNATTSSTDTTTIIGYLEANALHSNQQLIITGHSLGGNVANVFASYFINTHASFASQTTLVTFAAPAPGNKPFAQDLDNKLSNAWHYENTYDIVPKFPVDSSILELALMYLGGPASRLISVTYKGKTVNLAEAFATLAGAFMIYGYTQQTKHYTTFLAEIDSQYTQNTFEDFFQQAGYQHQVMHYASYLGVTLPSTSTLAEQGRLVK
ncbi:lipase family protein [uncultured Chitinophaga sp.]|jgi:Predicted lipase|uniref:lipase family protein n=1 Tax=uncultured Chitinophaga sp. TaxID=339340 RepID=UPI002637DCD6|nr:lipase family protein [uncultured Chitinophaga sp.]